MVALGLHGCMWAFSSCSEQGLLFIIAGCGFLVTVASLGAEQKLQACGYPCQDFKAMMTGKPKCLSHIAGSVPNVHL